MERQRTREWDTDSSNPAQSRGMLREVGHFLGIDRNRLNSSRLWHFLLIVRHFALLSIRPVFWLRNFRGDRVRIQVDETWPVITGSLSIRQGRDPGLLLELHYGRQTVIRQLKDVQVGNVMSVKGRSIHHFQFNYPLAFGVFEISKVRLTCGSVKSNFKRAVKAQVPSIGQLIKPADIAAFSIKRTAGTPPKFGQPGDLADVAIMSIFTGGARSLQGSLSLMKELKKNGYYLIVVDTSETPINTKFPDFEAQNIVDFYVHRSNEGWDFASWFSVLLAYPEITRQANRLLLTNDSNYGPIQPLAELITRGRALNSGVWGITDSWAIDHHLQSYFMEFDAPTLRSGFLESFISDFPFPTVKDDVVIDGEIGLTKHLKSVGVSLKALLPYETISEKYEADFENLVKVILNRPENQLQVELGQSANIYELAFALDAMDSIRTSVPLDPTLHLWDTLLRCGGPFIKRKLVLSREGRFPGVENLPHIVFDAELMRTILSEAPERFIGKTR